MDTVTAAPLDSAKTWYVMRDLKRPNAKVPAHKMLAEAGFEVFTPLVTKIITRAGKRERVEVAAISDLLFVYARREDLDQAVKHTATLQYRFAKGAGYCNPMTVREAEMNTFIKAVTTMQVAKFYSSEEITPALYGRKVRVIDGPLNGYEGRLLKARGVRKRRILVEIPELLTAAVEIEAQFLTILPEK